MSLKIKLFSISFTLFLSFTLAGNSEKKVFLHSENTQWKVLSKDEVSKISLSIFSENYNDQSWVNAIVPGTVFNSYVSAGLEKDPNFGDNIHQVNRNKYDRSFWYRTSFAIPADFKQKRIWLNFDGVNRNAEIYLNGKFLGKLDGFMHRGKFDISEIVFKNKKNILAVLVEIPRKPLANQGSPNYLSSGGWDWMPYVPGLNSGITDKVYLTNSGDVTLVDPWIRSELPTLARADLSISLNLKNHSKENKNVILRGKITPNNIVFERKFNLNPEFEERVSLDKRQFSQLVVNNPELWWPNGYGEQNMYQCELEIVENGVVSDVKTINFGIRKYTYDISDNHFKILINGQRVFVKGANWGMSEYMLRCRGDEYFTKVVLHKDMNVNMIRNWLGSTTDDEFYQACDKYGIMVWDDFWINSNPNLPYDLNVFNLNMIEKIKRFRNHPSIAVWCGDNESNPQPPLEGWMAENIKTFDGGDRYFQANSHAGNLTGSGPWGAFEPDYYFIKYPDGLEGDPKRGWGFRTEIGTAVVPNFESMKKFMPEKNWWPQDEMWNLHYFGPNAFNAAPERYNSFVENWFGKPSGLEDFCRKSQLVNYITNKAMYEGWLNNMWENATGILTWMGQSAYPSMVWQTYDYYYDQTGAYFGIKSACEPIHILWNPVENKVKIANTSLQDLENLTAEVEVYNMDGKPVKRYFKSTKMKSLANTITECFTIDLNTERKNLAFGKPAFASSTTHGNAVNITDGDENTRWAAKTAPNEWIYIDLGEIQSFSGVRLNWEAAFGKSYKIQISDDAQTWTEIYSTEESIGGIETIDFPEKRARYVRLFGIELGWWFGYSLWSFDVLGSPERSDELSDVHILRLRLKDNDEYVISENDYWRGNEYMNFQSMKEISASSPKVQSKLTKKDGKAIINAIISLPSSSKSASFATHIQAIRTSDGERILPSIVSDNYFTLLPGEMKNISIEFDEKLLQGGSYKLVVEPFNNDK